MDKAKVVSAYMRGFITLKECEQILGIDASFILGMALDRSTDKLAGAAPARRPAK